MVTASVSETVIAGWAGNSEAGIALFFVLNGWSVTSKRITLLVCVKSSLFLGEVLSRSMVVPGVRREVDDDLVPLAGRVPEVGDSHRRGHQPRVGRDDRQLAPLERPLVGPGHGGVGTRKRYLRRATFITGHGSR